MAHCAIVSTDNHLQLTSDSVETCQGVIVLSGADYEKFNASWGGLTLQDANLLLVAILGLWAVAWAFRVLIRQVNQSENGESNETF